jgi:site-specific DNA-methyltransferase (adenine-specific)
MQPEYPAATPDDERVRALIGSDGLALDLRTGLIPGDALAVLRAMPDRAFHAVVTDPPYGLTEYEPADHGKLRAGRGGVWRIPPTLDGVRRSPVPRFTVLGDAEIDRLVAFFGEVAAELHRVLVPGAHVFVASNPLVSHWTFDAFAGAGFERRGAVIRTVTTLRGGDRPKNAHDEFPDTTVMPRSMWEPWGLFRKPCDGTVAETLRRWGTGALRRKSADEPFKDLIPCAPARGAERAAAPHPSLKPQRFLRQIVRAALPLGRGVVLDPFAGSASTLAAASAVGYASVGIERDPAYVALARAAFPRLRDLVVP